jgi:hypothetical protein
LRTSDQANLTATLALRITGGYAGRTLVTELAVSDDDGDQQPFRHMGRQHRGLTRL